MFRPSRPVRGAYRDRHETRVGCDGRDGVGREERCRAGIPKRVLREQGVRADDTALTASLHGLDGEHTPAIEGLSEDVRGRPSRVVLAPSSNCVIQRNE
jgi:hypothetical protein